MIFETKHKEKGEISGYVFLVGLLVAMIALGLTLQITGRTQSEYATLSAAQTLSKQISAECQGYYQFSNISCSFIQDIEKSGTPYCFSYGNPESWVCRWRTYYDAPPNITEIIEEYTTNQTKFGGLYIEITGRNHRVTAALDGCAVFSIYPFQRWCGTKTISFYL